MAKLKGFASSALLQASRLENPVLKQLEDDHQKLRKQLAGLQKQALKLSKRLELALAEQWVKALAEFKAALEAHEEKEEHFLFKAMGQYVETDKGPLKLIEFEHEMINVKWNQVSEASRIQVRNVKEGKKWAELMRIFHETADYTAEHMIREEKMGYSLGEAVMNAGDWPEEGKDHGNG